MILDKLSNVRFLPRKEFVLVPPLWSHVVWILTWYSAITGRSMEQSDEEVKRSTRGQVCARRDMWPEARPPTRNLTRSASQPHHPGRISKLQTLISQRDPRLHSRKHDKSVITHSQPNIGPQLRGAGTPIWFSDSTYNPGRSNAHSRRLPEYLSFNLSSIPTQSPVRVQRSI